MKSKILEKYGGKIEKYGGERRKFEKINGNIGGKIENYKRLIGCKIWKYGGNWKIE